MNLSRDRDKAPTLLYIGGTLLAHCIRVGHRLEKVLLEVNVSKHSLQSNRALQRLGAR